MVHTFLGLLTLINFMADFPTLETVLRLLQLRKNLSIGVWARVRSTYTAAVGSTYTGRLDLQLEEKEGVSGGGGLIARCPGALYMIYPS